MCYPCVRHTCSLDSGPNKEGGKGPRTLNAGEVVQEVPTGIYKATNTSMTSPVTVLVVSLGEKGQPLSIPVK